MNQMISVAPGFQYSVNIGFDLHDDNKLKSFIPTRSSLTLLKEILSSTLPSSSERARVLIGAYGKGKSHIVLTILSILMKRDLRLFEKLLPKIKEDAELEQSVRNYYDSENRILPVIISGSNTSLTQSFLLALQRTLSDHGLLDVMPETNYKAAISVIHRWKAEYPETYRAFHKEIDTPVATFVEQLANYSAAAYEQFERIYPTLTAGSIFNPFLGFDVIELYESVAKGLNAKGYSGIYIIYDEFSKYLEANITEASVSDTKTLQDLAEKCNRSGALQMHLMLISHKEISNYIDKLPKQKLDGWRGVSERFKHIHLNNNFTQTYEIISTVIQKKAKLWTAFCKKYTENFAALVQRYGKHPVFSGIGDDLQTAIYGCYPLHPISTFILPRLSERVAQNERTLFTFLSSPGNSTMLRFLDENGDCSFKLITPDVIYDYFEPLFKKESYASELHTQYLLTASILSRIEGNELGCKIIKTIALIYILEQFEKLRPTKEELRGIFSFDHDALEIENAINSLIADDYVVYLKRSNGFLRLKQTSGVDIRQSIDELIQKQFKRISVRDALNDSNFDKYMYPSRYNDEREMTRYFSFEFIDEEEVDSDVNWTVKCESIHADGVIYGVLPKSEDSIPLLTEQLCKSSSSCNRCIFVVPRHYREIAGIISELKAVSTLRDKVADDPVLFDEYEVIYEDLNEVVAGFMMTYTHPEQCAAFYIYNGKPVEIRRKAALTGLMSDICDTVYRLTPVINNEAVNKDQITTVSSNSRSKIISGLLRTELEPNLGLAGNGQDVSIMRSTLIRTKILCECDSAPRLDLVPEDFNLRWMLKNIVEFINGARERDKVSFSALYHRLTSPAHNIGMRRGLIPIYLAAVLHEYKHQVVVWDRSDQVSLSANLLLQIEANPEGYSLSYLDWNPEKERYIRALAELFSDYVIEAEKSVNAYDYVANAMRRWFMALPKFTKECKSNPSGEKIDKPSRTLVRLLRQNISSYELLLHRLPETYSTPLEKLTERIADTKHLLDNMLTELKQTLIARTKQEFLLPQNEQTLEQMSLTSVITDWCDALNAQTFEQLFSNGTDRCLKLFRSITNDEDTFICALAKLATGLRVEDWSDQTIRSYSDRIRLYRQTAVDFIGDKAPETSENTSSYQISFVDENGGIITKRFDHTEYSKRGKLLYNQITSSLDSMGHAVSEQEKRQILMEILKNLC